MKNKNCVWPSGDEKPVCRLIYDHTAWAKKTGLFFESGTDDLDEYFGSFIIDEEIGPLKFLEYLNAPAPGVVVYVDSLIETSRSVRAIKNRFNILDADIDWIREIEG